MRIVVTGAAGFIGSHVVDRLLADGHDVVGVDAFTDYYARTVKESNVAHAGRSSRFQLHELDLRTDPLAQVVHGADVVIHEVWRGPGTLELRPNAQVPVHLLPVREVVEAFHWRTDFSLVDGEVIERFS